VPAIAARRRSRTAVYARDAEIDFLQQIKPQMPPAIAFFGSEDGWIRGWNRACEKWKSLENASVELQIAEGEGHSFFNKQPWADLTLAAADRFLQQLGFIEGEPTLPAPKNGETLVKRP